jgi:hypothetical protein
VIPGALIQRAARAVAEGTALINGSIGSRETVDPRAWC